MVEKTVPQWRERRALVTFDTCSGESYTASLHPINLHSPASPPIHSLAHSTACQPSLREQHHTNTHKHKSFHKEYTHTRYAVNSMMNNSLLHLETENLVLDVMKSRWWASIIHLLGGLSEETSNLTAREWSKILVYISVYKQRPHERSPVRATLRVYKVRSMLLLRRLLE